MNIYDKIKKLSESKEKVIIFVDMDGTIAEYEFFTKEYRKKNKNNLFINIRPLKTVINSLKRIAEEIPNNELFILSLCMYESDKEEKLDWLNRHAPFFKEENRVILTREKGQYTTENKYDVKAEYIQKVLRDNEHAILLEDTHDNLRKAKEVLQDKITIIHISSFID